MKTQLPGSLTASRITTLRPGIVAEVVIDEKTDAFGRWFDGGSWSAWQLLATGVRDVSLAPLEGDAEPTVLVSVVLLTPAPLGGIPAAYVQYQRRFFRLSTSGVTPASL